MVGVLLFQRLNCAIPFKPCQPLVEHVSDMVFTAARFLCADLMTAWSPTIHTKRIESTLLLLSCGLGLTVLRSSSLDNRSSPKWHYFHSHYYFFQLAILHSIKCHEISERNTIGNSKHHSLHQFHQKAVQASVQGPEFSCVCYMP